MSSRLLVLAAMIFIGGCTDGVVGSKDEPVSKHEHGNAQPPAELIIGTWEELSCNGLPVPPAIRARIQFFENGDLVIEMNDHPSGNVGSKTGSYTLKDGKLHITEDRMNSDGSRQSWEYLVVTLDEAQLVTTAPPGTQPNPRNMTYRRLRGEITIAPDRK